MKKMFKNILSVALVLLTLISSIAPVYATSEVKTSSLTMSFVTENDTTPMEDVKIDVYKLASFDKEDFNATWDDTFKDYVVDLKTISDEDLVKTAKDLQEFVVKNNITPTYSVKTDKEGKISISVDRGIYLVLGEKTVKGDITYTPTPCIIPVPYLESDGSVNDNVSIKLKYDRQEPVKIEIHKAQAIITKTEDVTPTTDKLTVVKDDIVRYYLTVKNTGNTTAYDVVVTDEVPTETPNVSLFQVLDGGTASNGVITWNVGTLAPGESKTVRFDIKVPGVTQTTTWKNQGFATHRDNQTPIPSEIVEIVETVQPTPPDKVQTGDELRNNAFIFLGVAALLLIAGVGVYCYNKKKKTGDKK